MRNDMSRVLTERPRRGHEKKFRQSRQTGKKLEAPLRRYNLEEEEWDDHRSTQESMLKAHLRARQGTKEFSDLIHPLQRYLLKQVGRPWNQVWSEICQVLKGNGLQANHVKEHVRNYVGGIPHSGDTRFRPDDWHNPESGVVYVDEAGFLRKGQPRQYKFRHRPSKTYPYVREGSSVEYHRLNGTWFKVEIGLEEVVGPPDKRTSISYIQRYYYVFSKRALGRREVKRLDLENRLATKPSLIVSLEEYLKLGDPRFRFHM